MNTDESLMGQLSARLDFVIPDDPPLFVLDLNKTYEAVEENINSDSESHLGSQTGKLRPGNPA